MIQTAPQRLLNELEVGNIDKSNLTNDIKSSILIALDSLQEYLVSFDDRRRVYKELKKFNCDKALGYLTKYLINKSSDYFFEDKYWIALYISEFKNNNVERILISALKKEQNEYVKMGINDSLNRLSNHKK